MSDKPPTPPIERRITRSMSRAPSVQPDTPRENTPIIQPSPSPSGKSRYLRYSPTITPFTLGEQTPKSILRQSHVPMPSESAQQSLVTPGTGRRQNRVQLPPITNDTPMLEKKNQHDKQEGSFSDPALSSPQSVFSSPFAVTSSTHASNRASSLSSEVSPSHHTLRNNQQFQSEPFVSPEVVRIATSHIDTSAGVEEATGPIRRSSMEREEETESQEKPNRLTLSEKKALDQEEKRRKQEEKRQLDEENRRNSTSTNPTPDQPDGHPTIAPKQDPPKKRTVLVEKVVVWTKNLGKKKESNNHQEQSDLLLPPAAPATHHSSQHGRGRSGTGRSSHFSHSLSRSPPRSREPSMSLSTAQQQTNTDPPVPQSPLFIPSEVFNSRINMKRRKQLQIFGVGLCSYAVVALLVHFLSVPNLSFSPTHILHPTTHTLSPVLNSTSLWPCPPHMLCITSNTNDTTATILQADFGYFLKNRTNFSFLPTRPLPPSTGFRRSLSSFLAHLSALIFPIRRRLVSIAHPSIPILTKHFIETTQTQRMRVECRLVGVRNLKGDRFLTTECLDEGNANVREVQLREFLNQTQENDITRFISDFHTKTTHSLLPPLSEESAVDERTVRREVLKQSVVRSSSASTSLTQTQQTLNASDSPSRESVFSQSSQISSQLFPTTSPNEESQSNSSSESDINTEVISNPSSDPHSRLTLLFNHTITSALLDRVAIEAVNSGRVVFDLISRSYSADLSHTHLPIKCSLVRTGKAIVRLTSIFIRNYIKSVLILSLLAALLVFLISLIRALPRILKRDVEMVVSILSFVDKTLRHQSPHFMTLSPSSHAVFRKSTVRKALRGLCGPWLWNLRWLVVQRTLRKEWVKITPKPDTDNSPRFSNRILVFLCRIFQDEFWVLREEVQIENNLDLFVQWKNQNLSTTSLTQLISRAEPHYSAPLGQEGINTLEARIADLRRKAEKAVGLLVKDLNQMMGVELMSDWEEGLTQDFLTSLPLFPRLFG
ncbi:hypothetical protein BLNAU_18157 [Blattamonas nauphoetae]|uniref:Uncharacterized protein n=1 Tax=Blattamonas nauphoetae TaxID=2049346 RepID=A0ABQ9X5R0_9EUKA|nr:hypothetical protein BLNAU_18157 [Blattamonas nauphoetae]